MFGYAAPQRVKTNVRNYPEVLCFQLNAIEEKPRREDKLLLVVQNSFEPLKRMYVHSLKLTFSHLKRDGWNTSFLLGWPIFRGYVSFREGNQKNSHKYWDIYPFIGVTKRRISLQRSTIFNRQPNGIFQGYTPEV